MKAMMGKTEPDPFAVLLQTGYMRFQAHCGVDGLAKEDKDDLRVLAVYVPYNRGIGSFRKFVELAKKNYNRVFIWEVWNPIVVDALKRYGFEPCERIERGEKNSGFKWENTQQEKEQNEHEG